MKGKVIIVLLLMTFVLGFMIGRHYPLHLPTEPVKVRVDTLLIHDTIKSVKPIYVERRVVDSVYVPVCSACSDDGTDGTDGTEMVLMEREQVVWTDSLSKVYASGVMPQVDSVIHTIPREIITIEKVMPVKVKTHWGIGVQVGMGATLNNNQVKVSPYVGVGVSYNIISW